MQFCVAKLNNPSVERAKKWILVRTNMKPRFACLVYHFYATLYIAQYEFIREAFDTFEARISPYSDVTIS